MSGTVLISDLTAWSVGSSAYLWAVEPLLDVLRPRGTFFAEMVDIGIKTRILDLQDVSSSDFEIVCEALKAVYGSRVLGGQGGFTDKAIYEEFLRAFRALIGLITEDARVGSPIYVEEAQVSGQLGVCRGPIR